MGNGLKNAGGLDGVLNWNVTGAGALGVDESVQGAPGRGVFVQSAATAGAGQAETFSDFIAVAPGQLTEAFGFWRTSGGDGYGLYVEWLNGAAAVIGPATPVPLVTPSRTPGQAAVRGLAYMFNSSYGRLVAPAGSAFMRLGLATNLAAVGPYSLALMKPYLALAPTYSRPTVWDPGSHTNPDLQLPVWPSILPPFQADQLPTPLSNMASYSTDTNISTTRDVYTQLQYSFKGKMRLDATQVDALDQFYLDNRSGFFVVRPDTQQLCVGFWTDDGAPTPVESRGPWTFVQIGLRLAVT
jgi:hypothetical protein